ncbi:hypothetical protein [uncultured Streptomyces sp.]|uniref:hypothetical protein n=1 Tax=uncultured Streptomyces sp. TaxID=174707 RepID=UPI002625635E|nr:hypothetical protein [uncultured Streptomyces sp.]
MAGTGSHTLARAERFVWLTARVLEQRRFAHLFLGGSADAVDTALASYLNEDGGYGHALEPDLRGPPSQPLHTAHALGVLDSIGRCEGPRAERICRYLSGASTREGALPALLPTQRGYPAAPSVRVVEDPPADLTATGPIVGLLHRNRVWHAWLFRATDFCWAAVESLEPTRPHAVEAAVAFLDGVPDRSRAEAAADRLGRLVRQRGLVVLDAGGREEAETGCGTPDGLRHPHDYARTPRSTARRWFTDEELTHSLDRLRAGQQEDGGWPAPHRSWAPGPALEARPLVTLRALETLRAYGDDLGRPAG